LGYEISDETVGNILKRHAVPPAPKRKPSASWRHLMTHYKDQILACDFFTVETLFLKTIYVLVFIELGTRRVHFAGCTAHPTRAWVTQQARQVMWELEDREPRIHFLIRDRDTKFTSTFDTVFRSEGIHVIRTPVRAPNANSYAERWIRSVREECLDKLLIFNETHLRRVIRDYIAYYNTARPHQGIGQGMPIPRSPADTCGPVRCRPVLGGILHDYYREAA
jgi:putative transposase